MGNDLLRNLGMNAKFSPHPLARRSVEEHLEGRGSPGFLYALGRVGMMSASRSVPGSHSRNYKPERE